MSLPCRNSFFSVSKQHIWWRRFSFFSGTWISSPFRQTLPQISCLRRVPLTLTVSWHRIELTLSCPRQNSSVYSFIRPKEHIPGIRYTQQVLHSCTWRFFLHKYCVWLYFTVYFYINHTLAEGLFSDYYYSNSTITYWFVGKRGWGVKFTYIYQRKIYIFLSTQVLREYLICTRNKMRV